MAQDWTDNIPSASNQWASDLEDMEANFEAIKSLFSGTSAPSNPVAYMPWGDTTNHIFKLRNEANSSWLSVWDMANNKPIITNLSGDITAAMIHSDYKDGAAGTASLRTLSTTATSACAGNDSRLSDTRTPTDATVTGVKTPVYTAGSYVVGVSYPAQTQSTGYVKVAEFYMPRAGTITTKILLATNNMSYAAYGRIYKNSIAVGTERSTTQTSVASPATFSEDITVAETDLIQLYMKTADASYIAYGQLVISIGVPIVITENTADLVSMSGNNFRVV